MVLFLISTTFLWQLECNDAINVGLAAGRYSGKSRPDLYRTPHALQRVFGPIGPSLHWGVFVTWQCMHFLETIDSSCSKDRLISVLPEATETSFFLCFLLTPFDDFLVMSASKSESEAAALWDLCKASEESMKGIENGLKIETRFRRLLRARLGITGWSMTFSPDEELLLSKTETGLRVRNWCKSLPLVETFGLGLLLIYLPPTVSGSCFNGEISSHCNKTWPETQKKEDQMQQKQAFFNQKTADWLHI